jgi:hypothetical protein
MILTSMLAAATQLAPMIVPASPEMAFACTPTSGGGDQLIFGLPQGLNRNQVFVSDPGHLLGNVSASSFTWQIGTDGRLSIALTEAAAAKPLFSLIQAKSGLGDKFEGTSTAVGNSDRVRHFDCRSMHGEPAAEIVRHIRAEAK